MPKDLATQEIQGDAKQLKFRKRHSAAANKDLDYETAIDFTGDPGRTLQEPAEDADINVLMKRMGVKDGSELPHFDNPKALYGDFSELPSDPQELAQIMHDAHVEFMRIPGAIRQRFPTPEALFEFMNDNNNYDEAVKLGLLEKKQPPVKSDVDKLIDKMDTFVSSGTGRDKEPPVPTSTPKEVKK